MIILKSRDEHWINIYSRIVLLCCIKLYHVNINAFTNKMLHVPLCRASVKPIFLVMAKVKEQYIAKSTFYTKLLPKGM